MHLFLTGKAGTGKTTFLKNLTKSSPKRMIVTAPTGIAAINAEGMTIHSFFQLPFAPYVPDTTFQSKENSKYRFGKEKIKLIRSIDLLVIDEISMVRADLLDAVDAVLRRYRHSHLPFGGVQLLMIGDLQQLAPVVKQEEWDMLSKYYETPFFFSSRALSETFYATIELEQTYRQTDAHFLDILNKIRQNRADRATLEQLNKRYMPNFVPPADERYIQLTTHNILAQNINERKLAEIDADAFTYTAEIKGKFPEYSYPTDETLTLKAGAQVMFIKNDHSMDKRYYNGMIGEIVTIDEDGFVVRSKDYDEDIQVEREVWENSRYVLNEQTQEIKEEVEGTFVQYPVRLAWAITIHKSQGLTFSHAIIDAKDSFAHGQVYVALSRCRTLEGMVLSTQLGAEAIISDNVVNSYTSTLAQRTPNEQHLEHWEKNFFHQLLQELFNFSLIEKYIEDVIRLINEHNITQCQPGFDIIFFFFAVSSRKHTVYVITSYFPFGGTKMTKKELKKLRRRDLLALLLEITKENELLRQQLADAHRRLANREIRMKHAGSIAEASLRLNGVFEAAQAAADQYLASVIVQSEGCLP